MFFIMKYEISLKKRSVSEDEIDGDDFFFFEIIQSYCTLKNNNLDFKSRIMTSAALFVISARFSESFK